LQPLLHDLISNVAAPALVLSREDGQIPGSGVAGWFADDVRLVNVVQVGVEGSGLDLVRSAWPDAAHADFTYVARGFGDEHADPTVFVDRRRCLDAEGLEERLVVSSSAQTPVRMRLVLTCGADMTPMTQVKQGAVPAQLPAQRDGDGLRWTGPAGEVVAGPQPAADAVEPDAGRLVWDVALDTGESFTATVRFTRTAETSRLFEPGGAPPWGTPTVTADDRRVTRLAARSVDDLAGLLLRDTADGADDQFLAAGSPWFFTLFGRDSLWAARMLLPFGTDLALSTLRTLARRQGRADDPATEEQPGKILHEVRSGRLELGDMSLPPLYYGTVDATPLFVVLLAEAWRWGADRAEVEELLPAARDCLEWLVRQSEESGWLRYIDHSGHGLSNQGWKDSHDSIQFADGRLADAPIALSEVQAYAYQAAVVGADLLEELGVQPPTGLRAWADALKDRFGEQFWVEDPAGAFPAVALDGAGVRVDSVASNMGHLLGTGLVDVPQVRLVAARLLSPDLSSGFGLRTLTRSSPRFSRLSYHGGTVWPHDTAVAVMGLAAEGLHDGAAELTAGVVAAAEGFDYRLPELYGGDSAEDVPFPSAYPAACRPQAWAAAAPLACLVAVTGVRVDAPARTVSHPRRVSGRLGAFRLEGLRAGESTFAVEVAADGAVAVSGLDGYTVSVRD
jgi:glycogen debranching enzyme